ncbi:MAG: DNA polymerase I [Proteobacteria bacterium]|nr:DNA polymerase I [Pseudomonadota bacterium]MDA0971443.1 DNA polymerase I [Pseudomonadota bacterium]
MTNSKKHIYLIDGSGYIFRAYYALPPLTRKSDGLPVGAVSGFCNMLYKFLEEARSLDKEDRPTHLAVIFDSARKNFRNDIYKDYKANRHDTPEDLIPQFEYIRKAVTAFNIPSIELLNYEADDLIATYKEQASKKNIKVTIISSDKDLMQLVDDNTFMFDAMKEHYIGKEEVKEKFGVYPEKVIDVQSLAGDSSDNIPGVPGIGIKTAAELINQFGSLENLLENASTIKQPKRRQALLDNREKAFISKQLVTLKRDVPVTNELDEFILKPLNLDKILTFLKEMEFTRLFSRLEENHGSFVNEKTSTLKNETKTEPKKKIISTSPIDSSENKFSLVINIQELEKILSKADERGLFAIDTETNSLDTMVADLVGISLSFKIGEAFYIPLAHKNKLDPLVKKQLNSKDVLAIIKPYLEDSTIKKIGQNIKYDYRIFLKYGIKMTSMEDTMLMSYALDAGKNRHNMDLLSEIHLQHKTISFKDVAGIGKAQVTFDLVDIEQAKNYACEDADVTLRLYEFFEQRLFGENVLNVYENLEKPLIKILSSMENNGIKIDQTILGKLSKKFEIEIQNLEKKIFKISGEEFNIASPKQLGDIIYDKLKIAGTKKTKKGNLATNVSVLENLADQGHEFPKLILNWRQKSKLKNTYTDTLPTYINNKTKRVHTSFLLAATTTGRLASANPNLQNIPIKNIEGKEIRSAFISEKNSNLISADYSQIEMRILSHMGDVTELKKAFLNKEDIHNLTASQIFGVSIHDVDEDMRRKAKAINFGIIYGISSYGLAKQISVSNTEAESFLRSYFTKFPEIKEFMNETIKFCRKNGYVKTLFDRKCHFPNINDKNHTLRTFQERACINAPIQGTAADVLRLAMIKIDNKIEEKNINANLLIQVHDELLLECQEKDVVNVQKQVSYEMEHASEPLLKFSIPLTVDIKSGKNWSEAH